MARFVVGVMDEGLKEFNWVAENRPVQGQFLITFDLVLGANDKLPERYADALKELSALATLRQDLSKYAWLFNIPDGMNAAFQVLVNNFGVEHHNYSVIELATGEGLAYDAKHKVVYEIEATH